MTISVHCFESIDSTSSEIQRKLQGGAKPPFAVVSRVQSGGRGRRGRHWVSPEGHLYLSLTLEPSWIDDSERGLMPIKVACILSEWILATFGVRVTIKWPNDICFGGKKLAGILCESSWNGGQWGPVIIGVGLNLKESALADQFSSGTIALGALLRKDLDPVLLARGFLDFLVPLWKSLTCQQVIKTYQQFSPGSAHCWVDRMNPTNPGYETEFRQEVGLLSDGGLCLEPLGAHSWENREILHSASHQYEWFYQKNMDAPLLVAEPLTGASKHEFDLHLYEKASDLLPTRTIRLSQLSSASEREQVGSELKQLTSKFMTGFHWPVFSAPGFDKSFEAEPYLLRENIKLVFRQMNIRSVLSRYSLSGQVGPGSLHTIYLEGLLALEKIKDLRGSSVLILYIGQNLQTLSYNSYLFQPEGTLLWYETGHMEDGWNVQKILENIRNHKTLCLDASVECVEILTDEHNSSISESFFSIAGKDIFLTGLRVVALGGH